MKIYLPVKEVNEWGWQHSIKSLDDFWRAISKSGQVFGVNNHPDPNFYPSLGLTAHNGIDIPLRNNTKIFASTDGVVTEISNEGTQGLGVVVWDDKQKCKTIYWHNLLNAVILGDKVKTGQLIAYSDNTGLSTGPHLHWGLKLTDEKGNTINRENGYDGAIDPKPYLIWWDNMTEKEIKQLQVLEGYSDPEGVEYWKDKPLSAYLEARLKDKVKNINELL